MLVGVTGTAGCGQSSAAAAFGSLGAEICSLDAVGHELLSRRYIASALAVSLGRPELRTMPGEGIRAALRGEAFADPELMHGLCAVLHPRMRRWARLSASSLRSRKGIFVLEGALLIEMGIAGLADSLVVVAADRETCISRMVERDRIDRLTALKRLDMQLPLTEKLMRADWVVWNGGGTPLAAVQLQVTGIYRHLAGLPPVSHV